MWIRYRENIAINKKYEFDFVQQHFLEGGDV